MKGNIALIVFFLVILAGCNNPTGNIVAIDNVKQFTNETLLLKVAQLPIMDLESIDSYEKYKSFVDNINNLIDILNEQSDLFNIEKFNPSFDGWKKASKFITKYGPLINNYNEVITSAKSFETNSCDDTRKKFYFASGKFAFETAIIAGAVFYTTSYQVVGITYRALSLNTFALKCPSCISIILSQAHWTIRTVLVEGASQGAQFVLNQFEER